MRHRLARLTAAALLAALPLAAARGQVTIGPVTFGPVFNCAGGVCTVAAGGITNAMLAGSIDLTTKVTGILPGVNGGTGVANSGKTVTLGGNLATSGAFDATFTLTGTTNVTSPTTGTLATLAGSETLTNKTLSGAILSGATTLPGPGTIASAGRILLDGTTDIPTGALTSAWLQITESAGSGGQTFQKFSANSNGTTNVWGKSRGSVSTAGAVVSADTISNLAFAGDDGSTNGSITVTGARISIGVDGTVSTGIVPMRFMFNTMNSGGTLAERLRLTASGGLILGTPFSTDPGSGVLLINGALRTAGNGSYLRNEGMTYANRPTAAAGMIIHVTDSTVTAFGATVAGGGANPVLAWYNGTNWTVIGQ